MWALRRLSSCLIPKFAWHALAFISAPVLPDGGNAAAILLDGCDSRSSSAARLRTNLLLPVSGLSLLFWQQPAGVERAIVLQQSAACPVALCLDMALPRTLVRSSPGAALARRIRGAARTRSNAKRQSLLAGGRLPAGAPGSAEIARCAADDGRLRF